MPSALHPLELVCAPRTAAVVHVLPLRPHFRAAGAFSALYPSSGHAHGHGSGHLRQGTFKTSRARGEQSQEPEDLLNDEYERQFEEKGRRVGGWEMEPSVSPPEHAHVHATGPPTYVPRPTPWTARAAPHPPHGSGPTYVLATYLCEHETSLA
ncbi:hypothetical protein DFH11DRAFT_1882720 [Phellopilus nigrolimitatus]|nr:hypothetical protein DFH11DRAFT_1882720 [Phellopilus nigrolimitatus]